MKLNKLGAGILLTTLVAGSSFAMEVIATGTMMKKDDVMMKGEMMKDDKMMKGDTMMKKDDVMMKKAAMSTEVSDLQTILIEKGYLVIPAGVAKGTFGPKTRAALAKFQKANGLSASGYFGPLTKAKIAMMKGAMMKDDAMMKKDDAMMKMDDKMMKATDTMMIKNN